MCIRNNHPFVVHQSEEHTAKWAEEMRTDSNEELEEESKIFTIIHIPTIGHESLDEA